MAKWKNIFTQTISNQALTQKAIAKFWEEELKDLSAFTVFLDGDLGAGKSFWTRKILKLENVQDEIPSPTYTYVQEYNVGDKNFAHFDLYRIEGIEDFLAKGFEEIVSQENTACLVEWPQNIDQEYWEIFPTPHYFVKIEIGAETEERIVAIEKEVR